MSNAYVFLEEAELSKVIRFGSALFQLFQELIIFQYWTKWGTAIKNWKHMQKNLGS